MRTRASLLGLLALAAIVATGLRAGDPGRDRFPHAQHAGLFPSCTGCHAGTAAGSKADLFPTKETCAGCHDGKDLGTVDWSAPHTRGTNVRFSHADHAAGLAAAGASADCARCHTVAGAQGAAPTSTRATMKVVAGPQPDACIGCHTHEAPTHLARTAECRTCHVTLVKATRLDSARIAALPKPAEHQAPDFVLAHGAGLKPATVKGQCAICHARESCERCHINGAAVPAIAALEPDARVALLVAGRAGSYPRPASHASGWDVDHGRAARSSIQSCANCHAQAGCRSCHIGEGAQRQIAQLPTPRPGGRAGALPGGSSRPTVEVKSAPGGKNALESLAFRPPSRTRVHGAGFAETHGAAASSGSMSCDACHAKAFCSSCHAGSAKPGFHPVNFLTRHGADAYGGAKDCGSCHNTQSFCKTCHQGSGVASKGRMDVAFHNGQPMWLLQHGEAARKGLEGCTSCHRQQDCARCHSATGGWGVNPHGSGFDASRMSDRNQLTCARCHATTPGRTP